jgi:hypothetical protein
MFVWNGTIWGRCAQLIGRRSSMPPLIFYIKSKEKYLELRKKNLTVFLFLFLHKVQ